MKEFSSRELEGDTDLEHLHAVPCVMLIDEFLDNLFCHLNKHIPQQHNRFLDFDERLQYAFACGWPRRMFYRKDGTCDLVDPNGFSKLKNIIVKQLQNGTFLPHD